MNSRFLTFPVISTTPPLVSSAAPARLALARPAVRPGKNELAPAAGSLPIVPVRGVIRHEETGDLGAEMLDFLIRQRALEHQIAVAWRSLAAERDELIARALGMPGSEAAR